MGEERKVTLVVLFVIMQIAGTCKKQTVDLTKVICAIIQHYNSTNAEIEYSALLFHA